jgi:hypothetical protein
MKKVGVYASMIFGLAGAACATDASADNIIMETKAVPAATTKVASQPAACNSLEEFVVTGCPLSWSGITIYGTIDAGVTWMSHGAPFNGTSAVGAAYLIQKYSNHLQWSLAPNGLTNSNIGIKGNEPLAPGWAFIFDLQAGFDPYSLQFSWTALGGPERRRATHQPGLGLRLEPGRAILQFRGLFGRQFTLWHLDRFPAKLADFGRCFCLRSDGRFVRFLADRLAGNYLRWGQYRKLPA